MSNKYVPAGLENKRYDYFDDEDDEYDEDDLDSIVYPTPSIPEIKVDSAVIDEKESSDQDDSLPDGQRKSENNAEIDQSSREYSVSRYSPEETTETKDDGYSHESQERDDIEDDQLFFNNNQQISWESDYDPERAAFAGLSPDSQRRATRSPSPGDRLLEGIRVAAMNGDLDYIRDQMNTMNGFFIDTVLKNGWTPLMYACDYGYPQIVIYCLENGADPNFHKDNFTPLMAACQSFYADEYHILLIVRNLIKYDADVNASNLLGKTSLMYACETGKLEVAQELINNGADLQIKDHKLWTPLHFAAKRGFGPLIRYMVDIGGDLNAFNNNGQSPADIAFEAGFHELGTLLERLRGRESLSIDGYGILSKSEPKKAPMTINKPNYLTDMEYFLGELGLQNYLPFFDEQKITYKDLLAFNETDLDNLPINSYGIKLKLWEGIKKAHKRNWQPSRISLLQQKSQLSCPDAVIILKNISNNLKHMGYSIKYLSNHLANDPKMIERGENIATLSDLINESKDTYNQANETLLSLKHYLHDVASLSQTANGRVNRPKVVEAKSKIAKAISTPLSLSLVGFGLVGIGAIIYSQRDSFFAK